MIKSSCYPVIAADDFGIADLCQRVDMSITSSSSDLRLPQSLELPESDVRDAAAVAKTEPSDEFGSPTTVRGLLKSPTAVSYYVSIVIHLLSYGTVATAFAYLSGVWVKEPPLSPIRASLSEMELLSESPAFEEVGEITLGSPSSTSRLEELNEILQESDNAKLQSALQNLLPSVNSTDSNGVGGESDDDSFKFRVPESGFAITKGSFTAWTVPEFPEPGHLYRIIIQIKLPDSVETYRVSDLVGKVTGSDRYVQGIPFDRSSPSAVSYTNGEKQEITIKSRSTRIAVRNNKVQLVVIVPGGDTLVKDTIKIKSKRLREDHEIVLVFGARPSARPKKKSRDNDSGN